MAEKTKVLQDGRIAFLNNEGEIVSIQMHKADPALRGHSASYAPQKQGDMACALRLNKRGAQVLVPLSMPWADVEELPDEMSYFDTFRQTCMNVVAAVADGKTITEVGKMMEMPSKRTILYWAAKDAAFRAALEEARRWRAEGYVDKIAAIAETVKEEDSKSAKVKVDAWKYLAEVGDREKFGSQTKLTGNIPAVNIVFQTGIEREAIPVENIDSEIKEAEVVSTAGDKNADTDT